MSGYPQNAEYRHFIDTGRTVSGTVNEVRVGHARRMLIETDRTISGVAFASGFVSLSNFNRRSRDIAGTSPSEYRHQQPKRMNLLSNLG